MEIQFDERALPWNLLRTLPLNLLRNLSSSPLSSPRISSELFPGISHVLQFQPNNYTCSVLSSSPALCKPGMTSVIKFSARSPSSSIPSSSIPSSSIPSSSQHVLRQVLSSGTKKIPGTNEDLVPCHQVLASRLSLHIMFCPVYC